jgi:hypothetical protein
LSTMGTFAKDSLRRDRTMVTPGTGTVVGDK